MSPTRHRSSTRESGPAALVLAGVLGALLIFVHTLGAVLPGLAAHYLYRNDRTRLALAVIGWAVLVIAARYYVQVSA